MGGCEELLRSFHPLTIPPFKNPLGVDKKKKKNTANMAGPFILFLLPFPTLTVDFIFSPENKKEKKRSYHTPPSRIKGSYYTPNP